MPLNLGGGGYVPVLRWKSNQVSFVITVQGQNGVEDMPIQLRQMLVDFWNIRTGWCCLGKGQSPQWHLDPDIETALPNPNPAMEYKRAFLVHVYNSQIFQGESVRQWGDSSTGAGTGVQKVYAEFEAQRGQHQRNEVPIVQMDGFTSHGQYNVPNLSIVGWTARPQALADQAPEPGTLPNQNAPGQAAALSLTPTQPAASPAQQPPANPPQQPSTGHPVNDPPANSGQQYF